ncbi:hypothetical protein KKC08_03640 [Patescibacteria group bacterium]|nr:hypothetical protein [Patescibacteria group bacterium]MBU4397232.1 hypothetical protein [Patescibacteria group bacterium]MBU4430826.1 hypothetical protein [Patescibacteria group bacterium]MCG2702148.1 hypothetical protein [Candidatus Parcubacteria bacterium]
MFKKAPKKQRCPDDVNANVVLVENDAVANSNTGDNSIMVNRSRRRSANAVIETGNAYADAYADVTVERQENGCCDEGPSCMPCRPFRPCGPQPCGDQNEGELDLNLVMVDNGAVANANTGRNSITGSGRARISSGDATSYASGYVLVGVQVNDMN